MQCSAPTTRRDTNEAVEMRIRKNNMTKNAVKLQTAKKAENILGGLWKSKEVSIHVMTLHPKCDATLR